MASAQQEEVTLTEAGTLSEKIGDDQKYTITSLKVSGPINGTDVRYLREMAGKDANGKNTEGKLTDLDLTDANIVEGGENYYSYPYLRTENDVLGSYTFQYCKLTSIKLPSSVTSIGKKVFYLATGLTSVTIGNAVASIGEDAFYSCHGLTSVTIPNSVKSIGLKAFSHCIGLTSVTIGNSVTSIGSSAFGSCSSLTSVTIPNSVTIIDYSAFGSCSSLTSVTIGNSVTSIGGYAFSGCTAIVKLVSLNTTPPKCGDWALWGIDKEKCTLYVYASSREAYKAADQWKDFKNVEVIMAPVGQVQVTLAEAGTLSEKITGDQKYTITSLKVSGPINGTDVRYLREMAGKDANGKNTEGKLTDLDLTDANIVEGGECYYEDFYAKNDTLGKYMFYDCGLTSIKIPNSVTSIGDWAFYYCSGLASVTIGNSVTSIGHGAFSDCSSLTSVTIPNSVTSIDDYAFSYCQSLTSVTIGKSVTSIGESAFYNCSSLTSVTIGKSVTSIGDYAFIYCQSLTSIAVEEGNAYYHMDGSCLIETASNKLIRGCNLTSVTIPNYVTNINDGAFGGCSSLTSIDIPNSVTSIGIGAFEDCSSLTSVTIPNSVTSIGGWAFSGCSSLASVTIPNSVTSIGNWAFCYCQGLTSVTIGESVTSIGKSAFSDCSAITKLVSLNTTPPTCGNDALAGIDTQKCTLYVPKNSLEAYKAADQWKDFNNMEEMEDTGISLPGSNVKGEMVKRYDTNGRMTDKPTKGLNILKMGDGTVKKVMVK